MSVLKREKRKKVNDTRRLTKEAHPRENAGTERRLRRVEEGFVLTPGFSASGKPARGAGN